MREWLKASPAPSLIRLAPCCWKMWKILDKDVALVSYSASLRSWKQLQTSLSSEVCSRRSPHPFLKEDFYFFFSGKNKSQDFQACAAVVWTEHNTWPYFPKTPSLFHFSEKRPDGTVLLSNHKVKLLPWWGMSECFLLLSFFNLFVTDSEVLWSVRVWQKGEDPNADTEVGS